MTVVKNIVKIIALVLLFAIVAILLFNLFLNIKLFEFYSLSTSVGDVPGLGDNCVQQGLDYVEECDALLTSCYMTDKSTLRIYVTKDGKTTYTKLTNADGSPYTGHAGGICHNGNYLYVAYNSGLRVFKLDEVLAGGETKMIGSVELINTASWCTVYDGKVYVGTYSDISSDKYAPKPEYIISNPKVSGEANCSIISVYNLSDAEGSTFGIDNSAPTEVISCIGRVQGGGINKDGNLILATSWGIALSGFYFYDMEKASENKTTYTEGGKTYDMIFLGTDSLTYTLEGPPMAEEVIVINEKLYIMNESASKKYFYGNLIGGRELYAFNLSDKHFGK